MVVIGSQESVMGRQVLELCRADRTSPGPNAAWLGGPAFTVPFSEYS
jgi:hypothetical protein